MEPGEQFSSRMKMDTVYNKYVKRLLAAFKVYNSIMKKKLTVQFPKDTVKELKREMETGITQLGFVHRMLLSKKRAVRPASGLLNPRYIQDRTKNFFILALNGLKYNGAPLVDQLYATTTGVISMSMMTTIFTIYVKRMNIPKLPAGGIDINSPAASDLMNAYREEIAAAGYGTAAKPFKTVSFLAISSNDGYAFPKDLEAVRELGATPFANLVAGILNQVAPGATYDDQFNALKAALHQNQVMLTEVNKSL